MQRSISHLTHLILLTFLVGMMLMPGVASAAGESSESQMTVALEQSLDTLKHIQHQGPDPTSFARLKSLEEELIALHLLLQDKFDRSASRVSALDAAAHRHDAMNAAYARVVDAYLNILEDIEAAADLDSDTVDRLIETLQPVRPEPAPPIFGSLPYTRLNYAALKPETDTTMVPAYLDPEATATAADTAPSAYAPNTAAIAGLAESLQWSPVEIYEWVKNNVTCEYYWGSMKGAEETLRQKSGNAADQAALLVAMLRAAGYPSRYVRGIIAFHPDIDAAYEYFGVTGDTALLQLLQYAGIPHDVIFAGEQIDRLYIEHLWVETEVPYANYRGAVNDTRGKIWIGLDTSFKTAGFDHTAAHAAVSRLQLAPIADLYLSAARAQSPLDFLREKIETQLETLAPGTGYDDLSARRTRRTENLKILPPSLQFKPVQIVAEYTQLPDQLVHKVNFRAHSADGRIFYDQSIPTAQLSNQAVVLAYEPETVEDQETINAFGGLDNTPSYLIRLRPVIQVAGQRQIIGTGGLASGEPFVQTLTLKGPNGQRQLANTHITGNLSLIGIVAQQAVSLEPMDAEEKDAVRLLHETATAYTGDWNDGEARLADLLDVRIVRPMPTVVTTGGIMEVTQLIDQPHGIDWKGVYIDADFRSIETVGGIELAEGGEVKKLFMQLSALQGSYLEGRTLEEQFQVDSVSTAHVLGLAAQQQIERLRIDKDNIDTVLPALALAANLARDIDDTVNQNLIVRLPARPLTFEDWTGIAYIKENPDTGEAGYMLSGRIAGGMTAWGMDRWSDYYLNRMTHTYAGEINDDPEDAVEIAKITATDMQQGVVGQRLKKPMQVLVRDSEGKPVAGATVAFYVKAGGGRFVKANGEPFANPNRPEVKTNAIGIARIDFVPGTHTDNNPTYWREGDYTYSQQVGENIISALIPAANTELMVPFTQYGFPDEATDIDFDVHGSGGMLTWAMTVLAKVVDQHGNPRANETVTFSMGAPERYEHCLNESPETRADYLFAADDPCVDNHPIYGQCATGATVLEDTTGSIYGASANIMAGGIPGVNYQTTLSCKGITTDFWTHSAIAGNCWGHGLPVAAFKMSTTDAVDGNGNVINAVAPGTLVSISANIFFFRETDEERNQTVYCDSGSRICTAIYGARGFFIDTDFDEAGVSFGGQSGTDQGNGIFTVEYLVGEGVNNLEIVGRGVVTGRQHNNTCADCIIEDKTIDLTSTINKVIYGVTVIAETERMEVAVDDLGRSTCDVPIRYTIQPHEYSAGSAYVYLYRNGALMNVLTTEVQGAGFATLARGFQFDDGAAYRAEVVLNPGTPSEIKSNPIELQPGAVRVDRIQIVDYQTKGCLVPVGGSREIEAFTTPANRSINWVIRHQESGVDAEILVKSDTIGIIKATEQSESGWITVRAEDTENPCIYKEARVYIGCPSCEDGQCDDLPGNGFQLLHSIDAGFSLGPGQGGQSAGHLFIRSEEPDETLYTPEGLMLSTTTNDIEARYDTDQVLRQVMAPEALVDIQMHGPDVYSLDFYRSDAVTGEQGGLYQIDPGADPIAVWTMSPYGRTGLKINENRDGKNRVHIYEWDEQAGDWSLSKANGSRFLSRREEKNGEDRTVTEIIKDKFGNIASKTRTTYHTFAWGEEVVESVIDPDGAALTTTTQYHTDEAQTGSYGRIAGQVNPDGSWYRSQYDEQGRKITQITPWLDSPEDADPAAARTVTYDYEPVDPADSNDDGDIHRPRTITETITGQIVSKTYHAYIIDTDGTRTEITERCATPDASYGDSANPRTVSTYHPSNTGDVDSGRIQSAVYPDGRMDSYEYSTGNYLEGDQPGLFVPLIGSDERTIVVHGTVDQPDGVAFKTTREVTIRSSLGRTLLQTRQVYDGSGYERIDWTINQYDADGRVVAVRRSDGSLTESHWDCCGKSSETDASGQSTSYTYDDLKRVLTRTQEGVTGAAYPDQNDIQTAYTYDAAGRVTATTVMAGALSRTTSSSYDRAGRLETATDAAGRETTYDYGPDGLTTTVTAPGTAAQTTTRHLDGRTAAVAAAVAQYYSYGVNPDGSRWTEVRTGAIDSPMYRRTTTDMLGRTILTEKPGPEGLEITQNEYDAKGRLIRTTTSGQADTLYTHDALGNTIQSGLDIDADGVLDPASIDRISGSETVFTEIDSRWWQQTTATVYPIANDGTPTTVSIQRNQLTGLAADGQAAESVAIDIHGNTTTSATVIDRGAKTVIRTVDYPDSAVDAQTVSVNGRVMQTRTKTDLTTTFAYDALGRRIGVTDPRTGTAATHYDTKGRVGYIQDAAGHPTIFGYDDQTGLKISQSDALGKITRYAYSPSGRVTHTWGDVPYPVHYEYDDFGRMSAMHTYRSADSFDAETFPTGAAADITRWHYDPASGLLDAKEYADGSRVTYTYTTGGKLKTRTWSRLNNGDPLTTTYDYDPATGELILIDYSDGTADITFDYDRLGRQTQISDAMGTRTFAYNAALQPETETIAGLYDAVITRTYESAGRVGRATGFNLGADYSAAYGFDAAGRFNTLAWNVNGQADTATYSYVARSELLHQLSTQSGRRTTYAYEPQRNMKTGVQNAFNGATISAYDYRYDRIGRRTSVANSGSAFAQPAYSRYGYNDRSELIAADRYLGSDPDVLVNPVTAEQRGYLYDPIGNRTRAIEAGSPLEYQTNEVNQYTDIGAAQPAYDDDGNMITTAGNKAYTYNAENRLVAVQPQIPADGDIQVEMVYDYMGRRVQKVVSIYGAGVWTPQKEILFVYDGWNMVKESTIIQGQASVDKYYVWGLDLSQSLQGAGGVGGLLAAIDGSLTYHYLYDANGNVGQMFDAADGSIAAHYEYDGFGNEISATGDLADVNPYRFSTKYFDAETSLYYYGYRYYSPDLGRWINRDPIGESGGTHLLSFIFNNPISFFDIYGLQAMPQPVPTPEPTQPSRPPLYVIPGGQDSTPAPEVPKIPGGLGWLARISAFLTAYFWGDMNAGDPDHYDMYGEDAPIIAEFPGFRNPEFQELLKLELQKLQSKKNDEDDKKTKHRGRIQAQGNKVEKSVPWAKECPLTLMEGRAKLYALSFYLLTPFERQQRTSGIISASKWMTQAAAGGGVTAYVQQNFVEARISKTPSMIKDPDHTRIDIEVTEGMAFVTK